jgi:hypothetical protein
MIILFALILHSKDKEKKRWRVVLLIYGVTNAAHVATAPIWAPRTGFALMY